MAGDFVAAPALVSWLPVARALWLGALTLFAAEQLRKLVRERRVELGKLLLVVGTALTWYVGIVHSNGDFEFTVTNVLPHGIPYLALLYFYARARKQEAPSLLASRVMLGGVAAFVGLCVALAFLEEAAWARWVFHEHASFFGEGSELGGIISLLLPPLLAVPQATHYWLDGLLWRRRATAERPAQRVALGFDGAFEPGAATAGGHERVVESRRLS